MSSSKYLPDCACQRGDGNDFEVRSLTAMATGVATLMMQCRAQGLCLEAEKYVSISTIACLVVVIACVSLSINDLLAGRQPSVDEAEYERVLETLVAEVRLRRAEMEAFKESINVGGARQ